MTKEKLEELREMLMTIKQHARQQHSLVEAALYQIKLEIDPPDDF